MIDIEATQVIKLILQFLHQNHLYQSYRTLARQANLSLNHLPDKQAFIQMLEEGVWHSVLPQLNELHIPANLHFQVCQQIIEESLQAGDRQSSTLLLEGLVLRRKELFKECRHLIARLQSKVQHGPSPQNPLFGGSSKKDNRKHLVCLLKQKMPQIPESRLLVLLGQSLKYQFEHGIILPGLKTDLVLGEQQKCLAEEQKIIRSECKKVEYGQEFSIEASTLSPNGNYLAIGTKDGLVQIYEPDRLQLHAKLAYQETHPIHHQSSISCLLIDDKEEVLTSADITGCIKVWRLSTGRIILNLPFHLKSPIQHLFWPLQPGSLYFTSGRGMFEIGLTSKTIIGSIQPCSSNLIALQHLGKMFITGSADGNLIVWEGLNKQLYELSLQRPLNSLQLNGQEQLLASCKQRIIRLDKRLNKIGQYPIEGEVMMARMKGSHLYIVLQPLQKKHCFLRVVDRQDGRLQIEKAVDQQVEGLYLHPTRNTLLLVKTCSVSMFRP